jgi:hypothetical protein
MKYRSFLLLAMLAFATACKGQPANVPSSSADAKIRAEDLRPHSVLGRLGKPLGTRQVVSGVIDEHVMLPNPLAASEVDGRALKRPVSIEIRGGVKIEEGMWYRLEGYESGEFSGPPSWLAPEAQQPFQFRSFFFVTKLVEAKSR